MDIQYIYYILQEIATPLRPPARAERNRRGAAALSAELWRTGAQ